MLYRPGAPFISGPRFLFTNRTKTARSQQAHDVMEEKRGVATRTYAHSRANQEGKRREVCVHLEVRLQKEFHLFVVLKNLRRQGRQVVFGALVHPCQVHHGQVRVVLEDLRVLRVR